MLPARTETEIVALARSPRTEDRAEAQGRLVAELQRPLYKLCLHLLGNPADAEDALQESLLSACRGLADFRAEAKLSTWAYRIALRTALDLRARRARRNETSTDALDGQASTMMAVDEHAALKQRATRLAAAMDTLSAEQRAVLSLFAIDGLGHQEIGEVLGVPEGTVWSRLHAARKKVAAAMRH